MTNYQTAFQTWLTGIAGQIPAPTAEQTSANTEEQTPAPTVEQIPAYTVDQIPRDPVGDPAHFPFIHYNPRFGEGLTEATQPVFAWFRAANGYNANKARAAFMDAVQAAVPKEGTILRYDGGYVVIFPGGRNWINFTDDPDDKTVIGVRFALDIRFYQ